MNKKAFIDDGLLFLILFMVVAFIFLIVGYINSVVNTSLVTAMNDSDTLRPFINETLPVINNTNAFFNADFLILLFFAGLCIFLIMSFFYLPSNPIFFIIGIIVLIILVIFSMFFKDFWISLTQADNDFSRSIVDHDIINNIFIYLPVIILILICIVLVVLYAKNQQGSF
jgi:hypothetical protein